MIKEVRKTHFHLGNATVNYVSEAGNNLKNHIITKESIYQVKDHRKESVTKNRQANFKLD